MAPDDLTDAQRTAAAFAAQILGGVIVDGPPPPGSPLARIMALSDAHQAGLITTEEMRAAISRIQRKAVADSGEEPI